MILRCAPSRCPRAIAYAVFPLQTKGHHTPAKSLMCTMSSKISEPPSKLKLPINVPQKLLMGPGPSNASPRILASQALPVLGHMHPETFQIMSDIKEGMQYAFQTKNPYTLVISGTGHAAMEAVVMNLVEPGDVILSGVLGLWGERFADMVKRNGGVPKLITAKRQQPLTLDEISSAIKEHKPSLLFLAQGESSTGMLQPLEGIGAICREKGCLLAVDTVASLGGVPFYMDDWLVDVAYTGSQKVLSAPPGTAPISFNDRAVEKMRSRKQPVHSYYLDVYNHLANYWRCDDSGPARYHHTVGVSLLYSLREGLALLCEEGLEQCWERHARVANLLYQGLEKLGLEFYSPNKDYRLPTVTTIMVPNGITWQEVPKYAMEKYRLEISGGLGPSAGKVWRIGLMGYNCTEENVRFVLRVLGEALNHARSPKL